jgi:microsomal dipeptidase-like Zn-dependent dipeptidase
MMKQALHTDEVQKGERRAKELGEVVAELKLENKRLQEELARAQEAARQLAAAGRSEAVAAAEEAARLERELSAVRSVHAKAVERSNQVIFPHQSPHHTNQAHLRAHAKP